MILRLNQLDRSAAETTAGWAEMLPTPTDDTPPDPRCPTEYAWPPDTLVYELHGLDHDEASVPIEPARRQEQIRRLIPPLVAALTPGDARPVLRLDGQFAAGELLALLAHLSDAHHVNRFAVSMVEKLWTGEPPALASVRLWPTPAGVAAICNDPAIGLHRGVRLRAFAVPDALVNPLLDTAEPADERWREIMPRSAFVLTTGVELARLVLWTRQVTPEQMKRLLRDRLVPATADLRVSPQ